MKVEVIFRADGQPDAVVGEVQGETLDEIRDRTGTLLRELAETLQNGGAL